MSRASLNRPDAEAIEAEYDDISDRRAELLDLLFELREDIRIAKVLQRSSVLSPKVDVATLELTCRRIEADLMELSTGT